MAGSNVGTFLTVASLTEQLNVAGSIASALADRDDMVVFQSLLATASNAFALIASPNKNSDGFGNWFSLVAIGNNFAGKLTLQALKLCSFLSDRFKQHKPLILRV